MQAKLQVFKAIHNKWDARKTTRGEMPAGEAFDLLCLDVTEPAVDRMEEMLYYRTKANERDMWQGALAGKLKEITVGIHKIKHGENDGKATVLGQIVKA